MFHDFFLAFMKTLDIPTCTEVGATNLELPVEHSNSEVLFHYLQQRSTKCGNTVKLHREYSQDYSNRNNIVRLHCCTRTTK